MSPKSISAKKTIYVDVDEEITGIIDKVRSANETIIALVVPKRASVFSSIVNLKLLKRSADQNNKRVVLITSNQSVLPLAGVVGLHAAPNLNSKPYIPKAPDVPESTETSADEEAIEIDPAAAAAASAAAMGPDVGGEVPSIKIENRSKANTSEGKKGLAGAVAGKAKNAKKPKFKVPNFNKFRTMLIAGIALLLILGAGGYYALAIAPNATVNLSGENNNESLSFKVIADTSAAEYNEEGAVVPSLKKETKKTESEKVPATGQKDNGNKASGTVTLKNCSQSDGSVNIPAGTGISSGDLTFIIQEAVFLEPSVFTGGSKTCISDTKEVEVIAQNGGDKYNVDEKNYTVAGFSGVRAKGSEMKGGTTNIVKVVSAGDVESAKQKLAAKTAGATQELKAALNAEGYIGIEDTFTSTPGAYVPTPAVDSEAGEVIVSVEMTYTMLGLKKSDLQKLVKFKAEKDAGVDTSKQSILDDGLGKASYQLGAVNGSITEITVNTNIVAGPEFDQEAIKKEIAGKKRGVAEQELANRPGVKEVRIDTKPFWNYSVPKNVKKINIIIEETDGAQAKP